MSCLKHAGLVMLSRLLFLVASISVACIIASTVFCIIAVYNMNLWDAWKAVVVASVFSVPMVLSSLAIGALRSRGSFKPLELPVKMEVRKGVA